MTIRTPAITRAALLPAVLSLFLVQACSPKQHREEAPADAAAAANEVTLNEAAMRTAGIRTAAAEPRTFWPSVQATGSVAFNQKRYVRVSPRISGRVEKVLAWPGERVAAGQTLFELFSTELMALQAEYLQLLGRATDSSRPRNAEDARLDADLLASAEAKLRLAGFEAADIAALRSSRTPLEVLGVRAPIAGTVVETEVMAGAAVEAGACMAEIADLGLLWVQADIFERDLASVAPGAKAELTFAAWPGEVFPGTLTQVGSVMDESTRTVKCRLEVRNPDGRLRPGMFAEVRIFGPGPVTFLAVPEESVRAIEGREVVFVEAGSGRFTRRDVRTGRRLDGFVEIAGGLEAGERVVTSGSFDVKAELLKGPAEGGDR